MKSINNKWAGQDVYIIGGGASIPCQFGIPDTIVNKVIEGTEPPSIYAPYMQQLQDKNVIGVNAAYLLGDFIDVVFFGDEKFWHNNKMELQEHPGIVVSCNKLFETNPVDGVLYIPKNSKHRQGISPDPEKISWNGNSGGAAINLAVIMGAKRIFLLGFDMKQSPTNHWHGEYIEWQGTAPLWAFEKQAQSFPIIARDAEGVVEIINISPDSIITCFPKKKIQDTFESDGLKIGAVTPHCSPERKPLLDFVLKRMKEQTRAIDIHIVIDHANTTGQSDISERFTKGLAECFRQGCDLVFLIEDDDYYPKTYIQEMTTKWVAEGKPSLIGQNVAHYYHIGNGGYRKTILKKHSSAHCTAVAHTADYHFTGKFYDIELWKNNPGVLVQLEQEVVSIKHGLGLCGGMGHEETKYKQFDDSEKTILKAFTDEEAQKLYKYITSDKNTLKTALNEQKTALSEHEGYYKMLKNEFNHTLASQSNRISIIRLVRSLLEKQTHVVELGCGTGLFAKFLLDNGYNYVKGVDFSSAAIQRAQFINPRFKNRFQVEDIMNVSFDGVGTVVCLDTMQFLNDLQVIQRIQSGTTVIMTLPTFHCGGFMRHYNKDIIEQHFTDLKIQDVNEDMEFLIVKAVRK